MCVAPKKTIDVKSKGHTLFLQPDCFGLDFTPFVISYCVASYVA